MSGISVKGWGAVSPAGWGVESLMRSLSGEHLVTSKEITPPGWKRALLARNVPPSAARPPFLAHARLRRTSAISQFAIFAAMEALGEKANEIAGGGSRLGIIYCSMCGCVVYSRRFYDETLKNPATASPLLFPETVYNAPSSHLAALLGTTAANYTMVGDPGVFLQGISVAAHWLLQGKVDACLVVGAEELDWLEIDAFGLFNPRTIMSEGAGAMLLTLQTTDATVGLETVTDPCLFTRVNPRTAAARRVRESLGPERTQGRALLCDSLQGVAKTDKAEVEAWEDWRGSRVSPKRFLGEGIVAGAAWQCVVAAEMLRRNLCDESLVNVVGCNQQAIGARFSRVRNS